MNTAEATAVNTLLDWLLERPDGAAPTSDQGADAAEYLAKRAHATLGAGITPDVIGSLWTWDDDGYDEPLDDDARYMPVETITVTEDRL